jgi:hypothetical protein
MANMIYTGARAIFKLAGQSVATATGVDVSSNIAYDPVRVLDMLEVYEFAETQYNASMSCSTVKMIGASATQLGFFPHVDLMSILLQPELVAELYDNVTRQLVCVVEGVKPENNTFSVNAGQVVANNLTFVCKRVRDVSEANPATTVTP